jgi:quercetin dioxygenase-like cupin family protein
MSAAASFPTVPVLRHAGVGEAVWSMGNRFTFVLRSGETAGALSMLEVIAPAGSAPPLHKHQNEAEVFVLLEGSMTYRAGDETYQLAVGSSIYLPRGIPHAFRVTGSDPARFLALTFPGGLEDLYAEVGRPATGPGMPDPPTPEEISTWLQISQKHGLEVVGPPLGESTLG